jgi:hypothetical protein
MNCLILESKISGQAKKDQVGTAIVVLAMRMYSVRISKERPVIFLIQETLVDHDRFLAYLNLTDHNRLKFLELSKITHKPAT